MFRVIVFAVILISTSADELNGNSVPNQASLLIPSAHKLEQPIVYNLQPNQDSLQGKSQPNSETKTSTEATETQRQGRFFYPFNQFQNSLTGNPSLSSVLTLNLNNLALVGLFLIGVFILLPSIIGFLTGLTGGAGAPYAAKSLRTDDQPSYMWGVMTMLDNILSKNNIDVRVCMEKATCHVSKNSLSQSRAGTYSALESALNFAVNSNYGQNLLSSYKLKDAVDRGRSGSDCDSFYNRCPYSLGNLSKLISTYSGFAGQTMGFNTNPFSKFNLTSAF